jgi:hypothetical protein
MPVAPTTRALRLSVIPSSSREAKSVAGFKPPQPSIACTPATIEGGKDEIKYDASWIMLDLEVGAG